MTDGLWDALSHDPRRRENAALRASDADREIVQGVLTDAYAYGRLDRAEFDERVSTLAGSRTLGELTALLADLIPTSEPGSSLATPLGEATLTDLRARAEADYLAERRGALLAFVGPPLVCWVIWAVTMFGGFPWPVFVMIPFTVNLVRILTSRRQMVESEVARLRRKQAKELGSARIRRDDEGEGE